MKKFFVQKDEGVAWVVEKIIGEDDADIVFVVPRNSALKGSVSNFHLIKREAGLAHKNVLIESVDEDILALAKAAEVAAVHPLLNNSAGEQRSFSDIVLSGKSRRGTARRGVADGTDATEKDTRAAETRAETVAEEQPVRIHRKTARRKQKLQLRRVATAAVVGIVLLVGFGTVVNTFFSKVAVTIDFNEVPWSFEGTVTALTSAADINLGDRRIPAEFVEQEKNLTQLFPASGEAEVSKKAAGMIHIYNAYSSEPQVLVATTRFETPDGKIFRINDRVVVPGADIVDGKIVPASIEVPMTADQAGEAYNIGSVGRLNIPGFKGSPKFDGFYGVITEPTSGGFIGQRAVPTEEDIASAKERVEEIVRDAVEIDARARLPKTLTIVEGAAHTEVTRITVHEDTDEKGNFSVFGEATYAALAFQQSDLEALLERIMNEEHPERVFDTLEIERVDVNPSFEDKALALTVKVSSTVKPPLDLEGFKANIAGRQVRDVRSLIASLPEVTNATISLWPFWRSRVPDEPSRIEVEVR